jgi:GPI ethanolamine phosphate transferase 1
MVLVGVLYLAFETKLLAKSSFQGDSIEMTRNVISRALIGAQVSGGYRNC